MEQQLGPESTETKGASALALVKVPEGKCDQGCSSMAWSDYWDSEAKRNREWYPGKTFTYRWCRTACPCTVRIARWHT